MITNSLLQLGNRAFSAGDYSAALRYYQKALEGIRGDPDQLADLYGNIGNVYGATGRIEQAIDFYKKAIEILRRSEAYARLGVTYGNIGNLYADRGDLDQAIHFYKQGVLLLEQEEQWDPLSVLYGNYSMALLKKSELQTGFEYAQKGMALAKRLNRPALLADAFHRLAKAKGAMGEIDEARRLSESAQALYAALKNEMGCAAALYHQASLFERNGDLAGAIRCLEQVVAVDEKYGLPKFAENKARLSRLRAAKKPDPFREPT